MKIVSLLTKYGPLLLLLACGSSASPSATRGDAAVGDDAADDAAANGDASAADSGAGDSAAGAGAFLARTFGGRNYKLYVPPSYRAGQALPLVVMMHGCDEDPDSFAATTQMNAYADAHPALVLYPEQPSSANSLRCWNWFLPSHQARGSGEPALVVGMIDDVASAYAVDAKRVFAAGLSAGAAMTVILGATYPDRFAAIAVHSGLEYAAATSVSSGVAAASQGGPDPKAQGDAAYAAMGTFARLVPVVVVHGASDGTVAVVNAHQVIAQWAETNDRASDGVANGNVSPTPTSEDKGSGGGKTYTHDVFVDTTTHAIAMELYVVDGLGHAWSGGAPGTYGDPAAPNATAWIGTFFDAHAR